MTARQAGTGPSPDEVWANAIGLALGGVTKHVRPLAANPTKKWKALLAERVSQAVGGLELGNDWAAVLGAIGDVEDIQIELLIAYDVEGRLGGADWIGDHATPDEIYEAFKQVVKAAYPFLGDAQRFPQLVGTLLPQLLAISGSSALPSGGAPETS